MKHPASSYSDLMQAILQGRILAGMTFSQKVWAQCARIPPGQVLTYGQLAACLGQPRAARAVGRALRNNPLAPRVPCHRVVGHDGSLIGYKGSTRSLTQKRQLLQKEGVVFLTHNRVVLCSSDTWPRRAPRVGPRG